LDEAPSTPVLSHAPEQFARFLLVFSRWPDEQGRKVFFSEEKKQKTFALEGVGATCAVRDSTSKVFWFFSSEKNTSLLASLLNQLPLNFRNPLP
jgi:hypothetical protein